MPKSPRPARPRLTRPFRSLGWSLAGVLGLSLSLPPVGFYPLAWFGLVPLLVRWSEHTNTANACRETYALALAFSATSGFWLLLHSDPVMGFAGGIGILLMPIPFVLAATVSGMVRRRFGTPVGLTAFVLSVVASEYLLVSMPVGAPWMLLGHTQVEALPFIQTADLGGVLLISLWVLLLNVGIFAALPLVPVPVKPGMPGALKPKAPERPVTWLSTIGESGIAVAAVAVLIALPAAYGAVTAGREETPAGYARIGIVQPGIPPEAWDSESSGRVDLLAELSDRLLARWNVPDSVRGSDTSILVRTSAALPTRRVGDRPAVQVTSPEVPPASRTTRSTEPVGILIWPQGTLPWMGSDAREAATLGRLGEWCRRRGVALITGSTTLAPGEGEDRTEATSALRVSQDGQIVRYDQMRRVPIADLPTTLGTQRVLLTVGGIRVATLLGFESLFGDHARLFAEKGADLFVVLARSDRWGQSSGPYQHLHATRLRAIETRRSVVVASAGGLSAIVTPSGQIDQTSGWMEQHLVPTDVPLYRSETFYSRHGDWIGELALYAAALLYLTLGGLIYVWPRVESRLR